VPEIVVKNLPPGRANENFHAGDFLDRSQIGNFELPMSPEPVLAGQETFFQVQRSTLAYQMLVQRRPSKTNFGVELAKLDFEKHMRQFKSAMEHTGATTQMKLGELEHWFGDLSWVVVERFVLRDDYEQAYMKH
jgi:hypothetical protein